MTAATQLARYSAMGIGALREQLRYRRNLHHLPGHDRDETTANRLGGLRGRADAGMTTHQIMALTRGEL